MNELFTSNEPIYWQRVTETFKHAYGQRTNLGDFLNDPEMAPIINATYQRLLDPDFVNEVRSKISDTSTHTDYEFYGANFTFVSDNGTANMAVIAPNGDAVSITSTVNN